MCVCIYIYILTILPLLPANPILSLPRNRNGDSQVSK